jgi:hypothetical protein
MTDGLSQSEMCTPDQFLFVRPEDRFHARNRHLTRCSRCGTVLRAGEGVVVRDKGRWVGLCG